MVLSFSSSFQSSALYRIAILRVTMHTLARTPIVPDAAASFSALPRLSDKSTANRYFDRAKISVYNFDTAGRAGLSPSIAPGDCRCHFPRDKTPSLDCSISPFARRFIFSIIKSHLDRICEGRKIAIGTFSVTPSRRVLVPKLLYLGSPSCVIIYTPWERTSMFLGISSWLIETARIKIRFDTLAWLSMPNCDPNSSTWCAKNNSHSKSHPLVRFLSATQNALANPSISSRSKTQ